MPWPPAKPTTSSRPCGASTRSESVNASPPTTSSTTSTPSPPVSSLTASLNPSSSTTSSAPASRATLGLLLGADHGDRAGAVPLRDLDGRGADAAGGAVHQHRLALAQLAALGQRELRGQVVHRQRRALVEGQLVGQRERRTSAGLATSSAAPPYGSTPGDPLARLRSRRDRRSTVPAKSTPSVNGGSGLSWYSPLLSSRSGKEMPTRCTSTSTSSGPRRRLGSTSRTSTSAGPVGCDDLDCAHAAGRYRAAVSAGVDQLRSSRSASGRCSSSRRPRRSPTS